MTTGRRAPLNVFQRTQRHWESIHPYNAAQAMELAVDVTPAQAEAAFAAAIGDLGLGRFETDGRSYAITPTAPPPILQTDDTAGLFTAEMNRPFAEADFPFRPFIGPLDGRRVVGLTYRHWVADSVSIRVLMRQWLLRLIGRGGASPIRLPTGGLLAHFGPAVAGWSVLAQLSGLLAFAGRMKTTRRVETRSDDHAVRVLTVAGPDGLVEAVRLRARRRGQTVGDVMLAAATEACLDHGATTATARRPDVAMGTIVDLRARGSRLPPSVFGLFLGFTMTPFRSSDLTSFDRLLEAVARERRIGLARRAAEASQLNMWLGYQIARRNSKQGLLEFYRKRFPLSGGLSSVNMTPGWAGEHHPSPLAAYHRVSPTGPLLPAVLTPTTLGKTLRVCCTVRAGVVPEERSRALVGQFLDRLRRCV